MFTWLDKGCSMTLVSSLSTQTSSTTSHYLWSLVASSVNEVHLIFVLLLLQTNNFLEFSF